MLTLEKLDSLVGNRVELALHGSIVDLIEEGYSEDEIKEYLEQRVKISLNFLKQYVAL